MLLHNAYYETIQNMRNFIISYKFNDFCKAFDRFDQNLLGC